MSNSVAIDRRTTLTMLAAAGIVMPFKADARPTAKKIDQLAKAILDKSMAVDMHSHVPVAPDPIAFDLASGMRANGFTAICATYPVDAVRTPAPGQWYGDN